MEFEQRPEPTSQKPASTSPSVQQPPSGHEARPDAPLPHASFTPGPATDPEVLRCRLDLMSNWADEPARPSRRGAPRARRDGFDQLTSGKDGQSLPMAQAPVRITLPKEMTEGMRVAWNQSLPLGSSQEQGGLLLRNKDGSLKWLASPPGDSQQITLDHRDVNPCQTPLANGHTHPYDRAEKNFTDVPFSGGDLAAQVFDSERLSIVQSGEKMFGAARTREFDELVESRGAAGKLSLSKQIERFWHSYYRNSEGDLREKAEAATRATTEWFHLLYYVGKQGTLERVDTSPQPAPEGRPGRDTSTRK